VSRYFRADASPQLPESAGFRSAAQSVHGSRTIMLADLKMLLASVPAGADHAAYERAVREDNVLGKKTASTRLWAWKKLRELYGLNPELPVFQLLRTYWEVDADGRPLLAMLAAIARDALLRASVPVIAGSKPGETVSRERFKTAIIEERGDRFSDSTMDAILSHLLSSWTESGHLVGRKEKTRVRAVPTRAATAYALALGYMAGARGELLFSTLWIRILDAAPTVLHDQAREASRLGWLTYRGVGRIIDITFPSLPVQPEPTPDE
jgi:hypothetical protein